MPSGAGLAFGWVDPFARTGGIPRGHGRGFRMGRAWRASIKPSGFPPLAAGFLLANATRHGTLRPPIAMKLRPILYWFSTVLIAGFMTMSAVMSLTHNPQAVEGTKKLGYPPYFMDILGTAYLLGALALLAPGFARLKEWAYAGFTFAFIGAFWTHLAMGEKPQSISPLVALALLVASYRLRPDSRRWGADKAPKAGA